MKWNVTTGPLQICYWVWQCDLLLSPYYYYIIIINLGIFQMYELHLPEYLKTANKEISRQWNLHIWIVSRLHWIGKCNTQLGTKSDMFHPICFYSGQDTEMIVNIPHLSLMLFELFYYRQVTLAWRNMASFWFLRWKLNLLCRKLESKLYIFHIFVKHLGKGSRISKS